MWTFIAWTIVLLVFSASAIRVPTRWNNNERILVRDYNGKFLYPKQLYQRRMFENVQESVPQIMLLNSKNDFYVQNYDPPLLRTRYPIEDIKVNKLYEKTQRLLQNQRLYPDKGIDSYQISASTLSPLKLPIKKEPMIFVTEGYRNVLVQGVNKNQPEYPQRKRKVTKIYKINDGGYKQNLLQNVNENQNRRNDLIENYRDDHLHEAKDDKDLEKDDDKDNEKLDENDTEEEEDDDDKESEENDEDAEEVPYSEHADPKPVPTKPIYPGEGQWAKPGVKHRVYNNPHTFFKPQEDEQKPSGYDVFEELEQYFNNQNNKFGQHFEKNEDFVAPNSYIKQPNSINPVVVYDPFDSDDKNNIPEASSTKSQNANTSNESSKADLNEIEEDNEPTKNKSESKEENDEEKNEPANNDSESEEENNEEKNEPANNDSESEEDNEEEETEESEENNDDFVPIQLYTQVRKSENEEHEPYNPLEHGRLKQVIKDSKIHTVYTEEGYEDSAYDHAGHEKKAENDQGYSEFERDKLRDDSDKANSKENVVLGNPLDSVIAANTQNNVTNNLITTREVKTTEIKDKNNEDVQLEIENEVKVVRQPNNSTKAHRYVKIYPKNLQEVPFATTNSNILQEINNMAESTTESSTVSNIEAMTRKINNNETITDNNETITKNPRKKRSSGSGFESINVDTDFIDKINHKFAPPKPEIDINKYPYYTMKNLNENSPLRYAENMDNIPVKHEGELSFYKMADRHECDDIPQNIDPIPEHVKKGTENAEKRNDAGPRIELGNKIDCLKERYFGENPLDSPFFKEETVGPVKPIFKELANKFEPNSLESDINKAETIRRDIKVTPSPINLMTTAKSTLKLTPKNIYDQIKLLDHLDVSESSATEISSRNSKALVENVQEKPSDTSKNEEDNIETTTINKESATLEPEALRRKFRRKRPNYQIFDVNKFLTTTPFALFDTASTTVLPKYKVFSEVFYKDDIKPNEQLNVFADVQNNIKNSINVNEKQLQSASDFAEPNAVTVNSLKTSEAAPTIPSVRVKKFQVDSSNHKNKVINDEIDVSKSYNVQKHYVKTPGNQIVILPETISNKRITGNQMHQTSSTIKPVRNIKRRRKPSTTTLRTTTNIRIPDQNVPNNHQPFVIDSIENVEEVIGLVPPQNFQYKTIPEQEEVEEEEQVTYPKPLSDSPLTDEIPKLNNYYFLGLKPPPSARARPYSEFVNNNLRRRISSRKKREAARPAYADLSRNRGRQNEGLKSTTSVDEVDDYVPHRPKNYHYDEKTGKIVYHNKAKEENESEEDEEYEEIIEIPDTPGVYLERAEDATHPAPPEKATTKELLATATPPPEGKGLLDFVVKLKNNPNYKFIPDPTTAKPGDMTSTTEGSNIATVDPKTTNPPEFLSILSKVKSDKNYKFIEDPKDAKIKATTATVEPEEDEEEEYEEEEEEQEHIQNSPGGQTQDLGNIQIFDIGDYLPKIKTVTPKTTIDYSKYKTIQRPHSKQEDNEDTRRSEPQEVEESTVNFSREGQKDEILTTTTEKISQSRRRTRPTTENIETTTRKIRRPLPSGFRSTKKPSDDTQTTEKVARVYPENYSRETTESHEKAKRVYRRRPVRIRHTTERDEEKIVRRSLDIEENEQELTDDDTSESKQNDETVSINEENAKDDVEILDQNYDKSQKHGGNYKRIAEKDDVEILDENYNRSQKHGGNYKEEEDEDAKNEERNIEQPNTQGNLTKEENRTLKTSASKDKEQKIKLKSVPRLTDVVPKPDHFYSDPQLPKQINNLGSERPYLASEELTEVTKNGDIIEEKANFKRRQDSEELEVTTNISIRKRRVKLRRRNFDGESSTTIKPKFIKDPSKRLYYYVPV